MVERQQNTNAGGQSEYDSAQRQTRYDSAEWQTGYGSADGQSEYDSDDWQAQRSPADNRQTYRYSQQRTQGTHSQRQEVRRSSGYGYGYDDENRGWDAEGRSAGRNREAMGYSRQAAGRRGTRGGGTASGKLEWLRHNIWKVLIVTETVAIIVLSILLAQSNGTIHDLRKENKKLENDAATAYAAVGGEQAQADATTTTTQTAATTGVDDPWVQSGKFTTGNTELDGEVKGFCDYCSSDGASAADNAYNTYLHITWYDYVERDDNQYPWGDNWRVEYALQLRHDDGGNCYNFCAFLQFCLQYFGYDATGSPCWVLHQSGGYGDHGLVLVKVDGTTKICDAARGTDGWMIDGDSYTYTVRDTPETQPA